MSRSGNLSRRSAARLAAVQALYQLDVTGMPVAAVIKEFSRYRLSREHAPAVDEDLFAELVQGVAQNRESLDAALAPHFAGGWSLERLGVTLRAVVRAGAYELVHCPDVPAKVVVNEYVGLAGRFFDDKETNFANAILDRFAKESRPADDQAAEKGIPDTESDNEQNR